MGDNVKETWKDILGYEGSYQVSDSGKVFSLKTDKLLKPYDSGRVYLQVDLYKDFSKKRHSIHRLVIETFIENIDKKEQVNHVDGCKTNNYLSNLEWCTRSENMKHAYKNGLNTGRPVKSVSQFTLTGKLIHIFKSITEAEKITGVNDGNIISACKGKYKQANGFIWKYTEV